jgi:hypothetical protein
LGSPPSCLRKKRAGPSSQAEVRLEERDYVAQRSVGAPRREPYDPTVDRLTWQLGLSEIIILQVITMMSKHRQS